MSLSHIFSVLVLHNLAARHTTVISYTFAPAFLSGIFWIMEPDKSYNFGKTASRMRRFRALSPLPTTKEIIPLSEAIELEDFNILIDCCWVQHQCHGHLRSTRKELSGRYYQFLPGRAASGLYLHDKIHKIDSDRC